MKRVKILSDPHWTKECQTIKYDTQGKIKMMTTNTFKP